MKITEQDLQGLCDTLEDLEKKLRITQVDLAAVKGEIKKRVTEEKQIFKPSNFRLVRSWMWRGSRDEVVRRGQTGCPVTSIPMFYWGEWEHRDNSGNLLGTWEGPMSKKRTPCPEFVRPKFVEMRLKGKNTMTPVPLWIQDKVKHTDKDKDFGAETIPMRAHEGLKLYEFRRDFDLTMAEAAKIIGVTTDGWFQLENRTKKIDYYKVTKKLEQYREQRERMSFL